jgi:hypothetical protein
MWKLILAVSLFFSVIFLIICATGQTLVSGLRFCWFIYGLVFFNGWYFYPSAFEVARKSAVARKGSLLMLPVLFLALLAALSDQEHFLRKEIALIIPLLVFSWLFCLAFFGKAAFHPILYRAIRSPFSLISNFKPSINRGHKMIFISNRKRKARRKRQ